jgi:signal transduction histidine kinase
MPPVPPATPAAPESEEARLIAQVDESLLSADERAYLRARRTAERKVDLYREAVKVGLVALVFLIVPFLRWAAFLVLLFGGIKLGRQFYAAMVEPGLRERLVNDEVSKQVEVSVHRERQELEGEHSRSLEKLSASIAHEIRNPITAAKSLVQQMEEDPASPDNVEYARVALGELKRVERSISHLLRFAREEDLRLQPVCMAEVLDSALETFRDRAARGGVEVVRQFDCEGALRGDAEKLRRVFINLVGNGIDALEESGIDKPRIEIALGENLAGTEVWVRVRDNGPGIDPEVAERIFNPFFTSKEGGTGLGLAITKKLVDAHGGSIEVDTELGHGTEFVLTFPKDPGRTGGIS